jgi:hypothetical protein
VFTAGLAAIPSQFPVPSEDLEILLEEMIESGTLMPMEEFEFAEETEAPPAGLSEEEPVAGSADVDFEGVSMMYRPWFDFEVIPSVAPAEMEVDYWSVPEHVEFAIEDYPLQDTFHEPRILIVPIGELISANPNAEVLIPELEGLLAMQPDDPENIPFIPVWNAAQLARAHVDYLDFESGSGVGFLTQYGQAAWPINNTDMFYAFQGLTDDGEYLISAILPTSHPTLPPNGEMIMDEDFESFAENFEFYLEVIQAQLNEQSANSFTPSLADIKAMLATIRIE